MCPDDRARTQAPSGSQTAEQSFWSTLSAAAFYKLGINTCLEMPGQCIWKIFSTIRKHKHTHIYMLRKEKKKKQKLCILQSSFTCGFFPLLPQFIFLLPILEGHKS